MCELSSGPDRDPKQTELTEKFEKETEWFSMVECDVYEFYSTNYVRWLEDLVNAFMPTWISVENRLPENQSWVLVSSFGYTLCKRHVHEGLWNNGTGPLQKTEFHGITHWMPMPKPIIRIERKTNEQQPST